MPHWWDLVGLGHHQRGATPVNLHSVVTAVEKTLRDNSPAILTGLGVSGTIVTSYLASKATLGANKMIEQDPKKDLTKKEIFKLVWKHYIPTAISGTVTVACIIGAARAGNRRTAASMAAYSLSEKAFTEYKEKVTEQLGKRKEQEIRDGIAQDKVNANPPPSREVTLIGPGNVLCYEIYTGRYFNSDMESLRKAQNDINAKLIRDDYASASDLYIMLGLPYTSHSSYIGWTSDKMLELQFSTALAEDGRPCITFEYNYINPF